MERGATQPSVALRSREKKTSIASGIKALNCMTKEAGVRCYRVREKAVVGIRLTNGEEGSTHIEVGDEKMPLDGKFSDKIRETKAEVIDALEGVLLTRNYEGEKLTHEELQEVADLLEDIVPEDATLLHADVKNDKLVRERRHHPDALVLIETTPGVNGKITFKGTSFDEQVDGNAYRVRRKYSEAFPPPGIQVLKEGRTELGSRCLLLRMMPSSSFRMERSGDLDGAPGVLTVVWKGQKGAGGAHPLEVYSPSARGREKPEQEN